MSERRECMFKGYLSNCHRSAKEKSMSEKRLCSIREACKLRKHSLCCTILCPKHPDWRRELHECSASDRQKGKLISKEVII